MGSLPVLLRNNHVTKQIKYNNRIKECWGQDFVKQIDLETVVFDYFICSLRLSLQVRIIKYEKRK